MRPDRPRQRDIRGGKDVFVHITAVHEAGLGGLDENRKVRYELQSGRDGRSSVGSLEAL